MGIFGRKRNDQQYDDQITDTVPQEAHTPVTPNPIDDVTPVYQGQSQPSHNFDPTNVGVPPVTAQIDDDAGDYIMADPPAPQVNNWDEATHHQHEDIIETNQPSNEYNPSTPEPEANHHQASNLAEARADIQPAESADDNTGAQPMQADDSHQAPDNLTEIRDKALRELSPLVTHLEQSPEERFHTTMMMLQATDDPSLVKTAYEAAQTITDEKTKAQALLDIVNEINYFTQNKS